MDMNAEAKEVFVGVDVSKATLDVCTEAQGKVVRFSNDSEGIEALCTRLSALAPTLIVLEPTGGLELALMAELAARGLPVVAVNPRQVRDFAKARGRLEKTDQLDAALLREFGQVLRPPLRAPKEELIRELDELLTRRRQLVSIRAEEMQRLHTASKLQRKSLTAHITWLNKRIEEIESDLGKRLRSSELWRAKDDILLSIPGGGEITSRSMLSRCPEIGTLTRHKIAKLVGVAPLNRDSGKLRGQRHIWGGRADMRSVLYMATISAMSCNEKIKLFAMRLKAAGKPPKVVIVACMHKLLTIMNAMIKNATPWNPAKLKNT